MSAVYFTLFGAVGALNPFTFAIFAPTAIVMTGELVPHALRTRGQATHG